MSVTLAVLKFETSSSSTLWHHLNISLMSVTFCVFRYLRLSMVFRFVIS